MIDAEGRDFPKLAPPGAGVPGYQKWVGKHVLLPLWCLSVPPARVPDRMELQAKALEDLARGWSAAQRERRVLVPPQEYDPETGEGLDEWVAVGDAGVVVTWAWVFEPRQHHPLDRPFAFALVRLDGADSAMLHAVDAVDESRMTTGMRVRARWRDETRGDIHDIVCFEPEAP